MSVNGSFDEFFDSLIGEIENELTGKAVGFDDLYIKTKEGKLLVKLVLNEMQTLLAEAMKLDLNSPHSLEGARIMVLKARQMGCSTFLVGLLFLITINNPNTSSIIVSHDSESAEELFQKVVLFQSKLPAEKQVKPKYSTKRELVWDSIGSQIFVGTAGSKELGRSRTIQNALITERAFYSVEGSEAMIGLLESIPSTGNIFIESTANGIGNDFHVDWENPRSEYTKFFAPWTWCSDYVRSDTAGITPTEENLRYKDVYKLTDGQFNWYVVKSAGKKFPQEYPITADEAFLLSGNTYFDGKILEEYRITALTLSTIPHSYPGLLRKFKKWAEIDPTHNYIISADTSEGDTDNKLSDESSIDIFDSQTFEQVGHLNDKIDPTDLAGVLYELYTMYNNALVIVERNNHGHTTLSSLIHTYRMPPMNYEHWGGLYFHMDYDASIRQNSSKPGFPTTTKTKPEALDALDKLVTDKIIGLNSLVTLAQMRYYLRLGSGKFGAPGTLHDDCVMSAALGAYILSRPPIIKKQEQSKSLKKGAML